MCIPIHSISTKQQPQEIKHACTTINVRTCTILLEHTNIHALIPKKNPVVGGDPDSSVLLQLPLYTLHPPNVHTSTTSTHILYTSHLPSMPLCSSQYFLFRPDSLHSTTATLLSLCVCVCVCVINTTLQPVLSTLVPLTELSLCHPPISTTLPSLPAPPS